ncbi:hypothetical protein DRZ77_00530 [Candidatus Woesearchaeota archaeon]|nr:MAG: hypothetical protein DRZ77_00530 [Candidatus Woesearchaeota archaeon]
MKIIFLGTGSMYPLPRKGCGCEVCRYIRRKGGKNKRTRSSIVIKVAKKNILIDCSPDVLMQLKRAGIKSVDVILLTHRHFDHVKGLAFLDKFAKRNVLLFARKDALEYVLKKYPFHAGLIKLIELKLNRWYKLFGINLRAFKVKHALRGRVETVGYVFCRGRKCFAYVPDALDLKRHVFLRGIDLLIIDGCCFDKREFGHMSMLDAYRIGKQLKAKKILFTHIGHRNLPHDKLEKLCKYVFDNAMPAYDGMIVEV